MIAFALLLIAIVVAADAGKLPGFVKNLYRFPNGDWAGHFSLYAILAYLGRQAFSKKFNLWGRKLYIFPVVIFCFAALEEISQIWFPLRTADWHDLAFGTLGILAGSWLAGFQDILMLHYQLTKEKSDAHLRSRLDEKTGNSNRP